jgi:phospholipid/cholesterol/gamma-HCH transport system substrate-binding protein
VTPPQASAPAATTYDSKTGVFVDPAGGTGIYADGAEKMDKVNTAETWVDLMLDPRQA